MNLLIIIIYVIPEKYQPSEINKYTAFENLVLYVLNGILCKYTKLFNIKK